MLLKDHPRLRGEQSQNPVVVTLMLGSPPLARGTDFDDAFDKALMGITPACAGNSCMECAEE